MTPVLPVALAALLVLSSCGAVRESRINPFNWFGRSAPAEQVLAGTGGLDAERTEDPRPLVADVVSLHVERYSTGAIIRATGIMERQGWWNAELVEVPTEDPSHLVLDFRAFPPPAATPAGTARTREVTVARSVTLNRLDNIGRITVQGANNARSSGR